jgi:hypothetical protein
VLGETGRHPAFGLPYLNEKGSDVHTQITCDNDYHDDNADDVEDHCFTPVI